MTINSNEELLEQGKKMKTRNIVAIVLWFTIIGGIVSAIIGLVDAVRILSTNFQDKDLNSEKTLWGILSLLIFGNIASLVFANKMISTAEASMIKSTPPKAEETKEDVKEDKEPEIKISK
ncbi:MAG: hypothetical protein ACRC1F_00470 [Metamycoplasmataceae bacterium]